MSDIINTGIKTDEKPKNTAKIGGNKQVKSIVVLAFCLVIAVGLLCVMGFKFSSEQKKLETTIEAQSEEIQNLKDSNYVLSQTVNQQLKLIQEQEKRRQESLFTYTVKSGDTLAGICRDYSINYKNNIDYILKINEIENPNVLSIGQLIKLPRAW